MVLELEDGLEITISKGIDFFEHWICFNIIAKKYETHHFNTKKMIGSKYVENLGNGSSSYRKFNKMVLTIFGGSSEEPSFRAIK